MPEDRGWLDDVFEEARARRWCVQPNCTTCGARYFRHAYVRAAASRAGIDLPQRIQGASTSGLLDALAFEGVRAIFEELTAAVRHLGPRWRGADALRVLLIDLHPPRARWSVNASLSDRLAGTPAGEEFRAIQEHERRINSERAKRLAYESSEAPAERRDAKRRERAERHHARLLRNESRRAKRDRWLADFTALNERQQLEMLTGEPSGFPLEMIPDGLVPPGGEVGALTPRERQQLVELIGRRRGPWGPLRKAIQDCG